MPGPAAGVRRTPDLRHRGRPRLHLTVRSCRAVLIRLRPIRPPRRVVFRTCLGVLHASTVAVAENGAVRLALRVENGMGRGETRDLNFSPDPAGQCDVMQQPNQPARSALTCTIAGPAARPGWPAWSSRGLWLIHDEALVRASPAGGRWLSMNSSWLRAGRSPDGLLRVGSPLPSPRCEAVLSSGLGRGVTKRGQVVVTHEVAKQQTSADRAAIARPVRNGLDHPNRGEGQSWDGLRRTSTNLKSEDMPPDLELCRPPTFAGDR